MNDPGYPDGCTQATHDAEFNGADDIDARNAREERLEELARQEIISADERFTQYLAGFDGNPLLDMARHFAHCLRCKDGNHLIQMWQLQGKIIADYQSYRVEQGDE